MRDYEVVKVEQDVPNEFLFVLDDGAATADADDLYGDAPPSAPRRRKGAYYKNIERKMTLKKKRANVRPPSLSPHQTLTSVCQQYEAYADKWHVVHVAHAALARDEADERAEVQMEVDDPQYLLLGTRDAEGEPDESLVVHDRLVASGFDDNVQVV